VDCRGNVLWQQAWGDYQAGVAVLDVDADQIRDIVYADSQHIQICDAQGERKRSLGLPVEGYLNDLGGVNGIEGMNATRLGVGAFADGAQHWWAYSEQLEVLGTAANVFPNMRSIPIPMRELRLALFQEMEQAPLAGYSSSRLSVAVLDIQSAAVFADTLSPSNKLASNTHLACILLSTTPLSFLVGYGSAVWKYSE
jgi:hypothetical protein